jgi:hypothetical protein
VEVGPILISRPATHEVNGTACARSEEAVVLLCTRCACSLTRFGKPAKEHRGCSSSPTFSKPARAPALRKNPTLAARIQRLTKPRKVRLTIGR